MAPRGLVRLAVPMTFESQAVKAAIAGIPRRYPESRSICI
jgi:hypothetical protein